LIVEKNCAYAWLAVADQHGAQRRLPDGVSDRPPQPGTWLAKVISDRRGMVAVHGASSTEI
jgi:hypothetical protein